MEGKDKEKQNLCGKKRGERDRERGFMEIIFLGQNTQNNAGRGRKRKLGRRRGVFVDFFEITENSVQITRIKSNFFDFC